MKAAIITHQKNIIMDVQHCLRDFQIKQPEVFFSMEDALFDFDKYLYFNVLFIDCDCYKGDIWEIILKIRTVNTEIIFILMARTGKEAYRAFDFRIDDFLLKPVKKERYRQALDIALEKLQQREQKTLEKKAEQRDVKIHCLRKFAVSIDNNTVKWSSRKAEELVAYLLEKRAISVHKEKIIEELWPDLEYNKAIKTLHITVFRARQSLESIQNYIKIYYALDYYRITAVNCFCEWDILDNLITKNQIPEDEELVKIFNWYNGNAYLEENGWWWSYPRVAFYEEKLKNYIDDKLLS